MESEIYVIPIVNIYLLSVVIYNYVYIINLWECLCVHVVGVALYESLDILDDI